MCCLTQKLQKMMYILCKSSLCKKQHRMEIYMNTSKKLSLTTAASVSTLAGIHMLNSYIIKKSIKHNITNLSNHFYETKFGKIAFYETGTGAPIIFLHNLSCYSSSFEWKKIIPALSKTHKIYAIDMLGCGYSDKPNITYTTFMYVQILESFIKDIVKEKTDIVASGLSSSIAIMASCYNPNIIHNIILINPIEIKKAILTPDKKSIIRKKMIHLPILGTLLYNICTSQYHIKKDLLTKGIYTNFKTLELLTQIRHETAHLSGYTSKYIYMCIDGYYTTACIDKAIQKLNHIHILIGEHLKNSHDIISQYCSINNTISVTTIQDSAVYPEIENSLSVVKAIRKICN